MNKKDELIDLVSDWTNQEKAQAISVLKNSMAESVTTRTDPAVVKTYVQNTIKQGLVNGNIQDYPEDFGNTAKSMFYKEVIQTVVKELKEELKIDESSETLSLAWTNCEKAKNLIDFRRAFKMYCTILKSETYSKEDVQEYVDMIDELDREVRQLRDYKRIHDEMFSVLSENDEELNIVLKANKMKDAGFTDKEICKVLGIERNKLNYSRKKVVLIQQ
jgi:polyhydroxyalkanoate synthesis regulator phasin